MLKNYLTATIRNLRKHKFYSAINIVGLAIGMAAGFLILQYVYHELTYDDFFENRENIYRVQTNRFNQGEMTTQWAAGAAGAGLRMKEDFPEVIDFVNLSSSQAQISYGEKYFELRYPYYAGHNFFEIFSVPLLQGIDSLVLKEPFTVVLSKSLAQKMFKDENPVGKVIKQNDSRDYKVTGVFEDLPERSHMKFDLLYSFESFVILTDEASRTSWDWDGFLNYVVLHPDVDPDVLTAKFKDWTPKHYAESMERFGENIEFVLQPLSKIHLTSNYRGEIKPTGDEKAVYFLLIIGMFVLFIAWINYVNLTTARALNRAKEVGIRKVMGSYRSSLIGQFMFESFSVNLVAFVLSTICVLLAFPAFNQFAGRIEMYTWPEAPLFWIGLFGVFLIGILLSGFYPAFVLSKFKPIVVLKGKFSGSSSGNLLRKGLVTFQFLASVILITGTYAVFKQMNFLQSQDLGVNINQNLIVKAPSFPNDSIQSTQFNFFRNVIGSNASVADFTASTAVPGGSPDWNAGGIRLLSQTDDEAKQYRVLGCDDQFLDFYGLELVAGRDFDRSYGTEETNVLFNEEAVIQIGFREAEEAINKKINFWGDTFNIVGVVKNYRQESPKEAYDALIFRYLPTNNGYYSLNINTANMQDAIASVERDWETAFGAKLFDFFFLDDHYNRQYAAEVRFGSIFGLFALLAILVACLGLFGLASYITNMRSKEVGVRKVLGASVKQLMFLLTGSFIKLVGLSILIAAPISWFLMNNWLENFENRIGLGFGVFVIPAVITVIIAIATVAYHTFRTARLNPAETLHDE